MNDDLINRKIAYAMLSEYYHHRTETQHEALWDALSRVPSAQPEHRWIPCSEKLPERGVSVLISHVGYVSEDYLDIDGGAMYFWNSGLDLDEELYNIAWMPLPDP